MSSFVAPSTWMPAVSDMGSSNCTQAAWPEARRLHDPNVPARGSATYRSSGPGRSGWPAAQLAPCHPHGGPRRRSSCPPSLLMLRCSKGVAVPDVGPFLSTVYKQSDHLPNALTALAKPQTFHASAQTALKPCPKRAAVALP